MEEAIFVVSSRYHRTALKSHSLANIREPLGGITEEYAEPANDSNCPSLTDKKCPSQTAGSSTATRAEPKEKEHGTEVPCSLLFRLADGKAALRAGQD